MERVGGCAVPVFRSFRRVAPPTPAATTQLVAKQSRAAEQLHGCMVAEGTWGIDPLGQGDLFDGDGAGKHAARYRGGATPKRQALPLAALRPAELADVVRFIQINQHRGHISVDDRNNIDDCVFWLNKSISPP